MQGSKTVGVPHNAHQRNACAGRLSPTARGTHAGNSLDLHRFGGVLYYTKPARSREERDDRRRRPGRRSRRSRQRGAPRRGRRRSRRRGGQLRCRRSTAASGRCPSEAAGSALPASVQRGWPRAAARAAASRRSSPVECALRRRAAEGPAQVPPARRASALKPAIAPRSS